MNHVHKQSTDSNVSSESDLALSRMQALLERYKVAISIVQRTSCMTMEDLITWHGILHVDFYVSPSVSVHNGAPEIVLFSKSRCVTEYCHVSCKTRRHVDPLRIVRSCNVSAHELLLEVLGFIDQQKAKRCRTGGGLRSCWHAASLQLFPHPEPTPPSTGRLLE
jgi:hypothetical protein